MSKNRNYFAYVLLTFLLLAMVFVGEKAYTHAIAYEDATTQMVATQVVEEQAKLQLERFAKSLFGDFIEDDLEANYLEIKEQQEMSKSKAEKYTLYFMLLLCVLLCSFVFLNLRTFVFFGAISAMITLFFGLVSPILMVTIHQEVEYLGSIVLSFESKGVIGSIIELFNNGDTVVAWVVLLFSVLIPILKVFSLLFVTVFMQYIFSHSIVKFFKFIGKWSMVDVFVVAVFLVYLTTNNSDVSRAEIEVGLYFFLAYVIVAMLLSFVADKMFKDLKA